MQRPTGGVAYLDGIRGVAAFLVFIHHFFLAFYIAFYSWDMNASHLNGLEITYGKSVLSFLSNGNFCVQVFFVLSGFVLSRKYLRTNDLEVVISGFHRRFLRLYIPVAFVLIIAFILMEAGLYFNKPVSIIAHSEWWYGGLWDFPDPVAKLLAGLSYSVMFCADNSLDTSLWTLSLELYGSMFVFAFLAFTHFTKYRQFMLLLVGCYFWIILNTANMAFVLGICLCFTEMSVERKNGKYNWLAALVLLPAALILGSYPSGGSEQGTIFEHWHVGRSFTDWFHVAGAYLLVLSFILTPSLQRFFSEKIFRFLGFISFSLYLLHPLLLGSLTSRLFLWLHKSYSMNYNTAVLVSFVITIPLLFALSWLMSVYVDQYGIRLAKKVYLKLKRPVIGEG